MLSRWEWCWLLIVLFNRYDVTPFLILLLCIHIQELFRRVSEWRHWSIRHHRSCCFCTVDKILSTFHLPWISSALDFSSLHDVKTLIAAIQTSIAITDKFFFILFIKFFDSTWGVRYGVLCKKILSYYSSVICWYSFCFFPFAISLQR